MDEVLSDVLASPIVGFAASAIGIAVVTLWLAAAWWSYVDASRRSDARLAPFAAAAWIVLGTPLLLPLSLAIYRLARPQETVAEAHEQGLALELNHAAAFSSPNCPTCGAGVDASWLRCPACATWLAAPCEGCGRPSAVELEACPFCGDEGSRAAPAAPAGYRKAAASELPAAAGVPTVQRRRIASSVRPASYAASRESSSASS